MSSAAAVPPTGPPSNPASVGALPSEIPPADPAAAVDDVTYGGRFALRDRTLRQHAARGTIVNGGFLTALTVLGFARGIILAALLSPADYGVWGIIVVSLGTLGWLKQVGISDKYIQQEDADQELAFQRAFTLELVFNAILFVVIGVATPVMAVVYGHSEIIAPGLALLGLLPAVSLQAPLWILYRRMEFARQRSLQAIDPVVGFVVAVGLAVAGAGYWCFVGGALAGAWAAALAAVRSCPYPLRLRYDGATARSYVRFSGPLMASSLGGIVIAQGSILAGERAAGLAAAGAITLASTVSLLSNRVDEIITSTLYPAICAVRDRTELLFETFVKSNRLALMWAMPFGIGLALFAPDAVRVGLGDAWKPAVEPLQAFGFAAAFGHLGFNWTAYFQARGNTRPIMVYSLSTAAFFLAVSLPLILLDGLRGLAWGPVGMTALGLVVRAIYLRRLFSGFAMRPHALRAIAPTVPAVAAIGLLRLGEGGGGRPIALIAAEVAVYAVVTTAGTWAFERDLLREAAGYVRGGPAPL